MNEEGRDERLEQYQNIFLRIMDSDATMAYHHAKTMCCLEELQEQFVGVNEHIQALYEALRDNREITEKDIPKFESTLKHQVGFSPPFKHDSSS